MSTDEAETRQRSDFRGGLITVVVICTISLWAWSCTRREDALDRNFSLVARGMTESQVIALVGRPKWRDPCGAGYYNFVQPISGSENCMVYASSFAPLIPHYPVVYLDSQQRVIERFAYDSP